MADSTVAESMNVFAQVEGDFLFRLHPTRGHGEANALMRSHPKEWKLERRQITFPNSGRNYLALGACEVGFDRWVPDGVFDVPLATPVQVRRGQTGIAFGELAFTADMLQTRDEALQMVARENGLILADLPDGEALGFSDCWWAVIELGSELKTSWLNIDLSGHVGMLSYDHCQACRIIRPTGAEKMRFEPWCNVRISTGKIGCENVHITKARAWAKSYNEASRERGKSVSARVELVGEALEQTH